LKTIKNTDFHQSNFPAYLVLTATALLTLGMLCWLFIQSSYGLDITDESFYLIWLSNPWIYKSSISQFGFIYHPLHKLLHGDITLLRQTNILIIFGLTWALFITFFRNILTLSKTTIHWRSGPMIALAAAFATTSFVYFCTFRWLVTPSYNSLNLQAFLLASIGVLLVEKKTSRTSIAAWIIIGIAGWLSLMAKPTSAAALGVIILTYLLLAKKFNARLLLISILTSLTLLLLTAWMIDGSLHGFIDRYTTGLANLKLMNLEGKLFRLDRFHFAKYEKYLLAILSITLCALTSFIASNKQRLNTLGVSLTLIDVLIGSAIMLNLIPVQTDPNDFIGMQIVAIPISALLIALLFMKAKFFYLIPRSQWALVLFFATLPHAFALGTTNNYWQQGQLAGIFWVLAGLVFLMPLVSTKNNWKILLPFAVSAQFITIFLLQLAMAFPYRQTEPLSQNNTAVNVGASHSKLKLSQSNADFFRQAQDSANKAGFKVNTPVIDLTGQSPGIVYVIGGKAIGQPWMIGGYLGSEQLATAVLQSVDCREIAAAWLLVEPQSKLQISAMMLDKFGIQVKTDYHLATTFTMPAGMGGENSTINRKQYLLKPEHAIRVENNCASNLGSI
jgi:hypothetical protein